MSKPVASLSQPVQSIGINAQTVIARRYARKDINGQPLETWPEIVSRVVKYVAKAESDPDHRHQFHQEATQLLLNRQFIPNTPCLVNAGHERAQLAACFVLPIADSIASIMEHAKQCAIIHQTGGGTGMTYEWLRPAGAIVKSTHGVASGPVSFMNIVNATTETIRQGGVRRGANMGILAIQHPDILRFIHAKNDQTSLTNFNISVTVTDAFLQAVERNEWFQTEFDGKPWVQPIIDPLTGQNYVFEGTEPPQPGMVFAPDVWQRIVFSAWKYAEPGIIFIDEVNRRNHVLKSLGRISASNPCAEQMLHSYNACNLGSLDVAKFANETGEIDWAGLQKAIRTCVRFLDNVIEVCFWPLPEVKQMVHRTRPIGLGVMGFADLLLKQKIRYASPESLKVAEELMRFIRREAWLASCELGKEKGVFPELESNHEAYESFFETELRIPATECTPRNYEVTTVAPTGTISLVAETSSGIEPNFSWAYVRHDTIGTRVYVHPLAARALGIEFDPQDPTSMERAATVVCERQSQLPAEFITSHQISPDDHLQILAAFQKHVDNSISKTVNGPASHTVEQIDQLFRTAARLGVKAVSYYRDSSREGQVLTQLASSKPSEAPAPVSTPPEESAAVIEPTTKNRPKELQGWTWQIPFEGQNLYVTVNHDGTNVLEVFATGPVSGSVGMLVSRMLRGGFTPPEVARILNKVTGTHATWFNRRCLSSPEQAIAECILMTMNRLEGKNEPASTKVASVKATASRAGYRACPECGSEVNHASNCDICPVCGWSKCT